MLKWLKARRTVTKEPPPPRTPGRYFAFRVTDTFTIRGRGLVVSGVFDPSFESAVSLRDRLELVRPDGTKAQATVAGIDRFPTPPPPENYVALLLDPKLASSDVPAGSEAWLIVE